MGTVVELRDMTKRREAAGVAFEISVPELRIVRGSFTAVVGASGCGKSTLLDLLAMVLRPSRCAVFDFHRRQSGDRVDVGALWETGNEAGLASLRRLHLGYVLQTGGLLPFLNVGANLRLPFRLAGDPCDEREIRDLAERFGIGDQLSKKPHLLSGGQRQRAAILRAIARQPDLILADEPTAAVDKLRARAIVEDFRALARERGATVVMVTHDIDLVEGVADTVVDFETRQESQTLTRSVCRAKVA